MRFGYIKAAAASLNIKIAVCDKNADRIIAEIKAASIHGAELLVLPELCVTGATCGDLFLQSSLLASAKNAVIKIARACVGINTLVFIGAPILAENNIYNCAFAIYNGEILAAIPKNVLSKADERFFANAPSCAINVRMADKNVKIYNKILFKIGENFEGSIAVQLGDENNSIISTAQKYASLGANIIVNMVAAPDIAGFGEKQKMNIISQSSNLTCSYIYCNCGQGESTTDNVYSGRQIIAENGILLAQTDAFTRKNSCVDIDVEKLNITRRKRGFVLETINDFDFICVDLPQKNFTPEAHTSQTPFIDINYDENARKKYFDEIFNMQAYGLAKRMAHINAKTAVIGVSGGLDSTLALLVICKTFSLLKIPVEEICAITMPCFGTSDHTHNNARALCNLLKINLREIDIKNTVLSHFNDIGHNESEQNAAYENAQARMRTMIMFDIANKENGIVVGTGDLSEIALGWCTFGADQLSMYNVNCSVPKTLIREIVSYLSQSYDIELKNLLTEIINTPISPELVVPAPGEQFQSTEKIIGPYDLHDFFLYYVIKYGFTPQKIYMLAKNAFYDKYTPEIILKTLSIFYSRFFSQQFKRSCMPDGPQCTEISLSPRTAYLIPSDANSDLWKKEVDKLWKAL